MIFNHLTFIRIYAYMHYFVDTFYFLYEYSKEILWLDCKIIVTLDLL